MAAGRNQWVAGGNAGDKPRRRHGSANGETANQREQGEGKMSRGTAGSPSTRRCTRWWQRRANGDGIAEAVRRTAAKKTRPTRRCRASTSDCLEEEEEEATAVLLVQLDLLPAAGVDGGAHGQVSVQARRLGFRCNGGKKGREGA